jgi:hypothetical protein
VQVDQVSGTPQLIIRVNRKAVSRYGINVEDVQATIRVARRKIDAPLHDYLGPADPNETEAADAILLRDDRAPVADHQLSPGISGLE